MNSNRGRELDAVVEDGESSSFGCGFEVGGDEVSMGNAGSDNLGVTPCGDGIRLIVLRWQDD
jgi:hypothetical protein